ERIAYVRMFSGTVRTRDRLRFGRGVEEKVTAISVFDRGRSVQRACITAGEIGRLWGLGTVQIGERIGEMPARATGHEFALPTLESVVVPNDPGDKGRLRVALAQLAEQDPLINVRQHDVREEISVSLYGEVQKEVIGATLESEYGIEVDFRETTTICIERPAGTGGAVEILFAKTKTNITGRSSPYSTNPFRATLALRIDPSPAGSGIEFRQSVDIRLVPLYIYKTLGVFVEQMGLYVREALQEGLSGWQVTDCTVTMTECGYGAPGTTAGDFRKVTPLVLMRALEEAGTSVCEPMARVRLEVPAASAGTVLSALARLGAGVQTPSQGPVPVIETVLPVARVHELQRRLPGLTGGEGVLESEPGGYRPVTGPAPTRPRTTANPLNRQEYLLHVMRRV
ncbi:MAG: GTP-binding protein, partial [Dehalococcoidia bacterium]